MIQETVWGNKSGHEFSPDTALLSVGIATHKFVIEPGKDTTVGGWLQVGMADEHGFKTYGVVTAPGANASNPESWRKITPEPGQLRTRKPRLRKA